MRGRHTPLLPANSMPGQQCNKLMPKLQCKSVQMVPAAHLLLLVARTHLLKLFRRNLLHRKPQRTVVLGMH
jgi:hypothetical protein